MDAEIKLDLKNIEEVIKFISKKTYVAVGVTEENNLRDDTSQTNSEIAMLHEFGGNIVDYSDEGEPVIIELPERPIMRYALPKYLPKQIKKFKSTQGSLDPVSDLGEFIGEEAVGVVQDNFAQQGMPMKWQPISNYTIEKRIEKGNNSTKVLDDTGQLKSAFGYEVVR